MTLARCVQRSGDRYREATIPGATEQGKAVLNDLNGFMPTLLLFSLVPAYSGPNAVYQRTANGRETEGALLVVQTFPCEFPDRLPHSRGVLGDTENID